MSENLVTVVPKDADVPHPYDSKQRIKVGGEQMRMCGQVRRLIRRNQVTIENKAAAPAKGKDSVESPSEDKTPVKKKTARKSAPGHQSKSVSTES